MVDTLYRRIETPDSLPPAGAPNIRSREKSDLDFKGYADAKVSWEHAKDVAAFANALGGVLVVGADDTSGELRYTGLRNQTVSEVKAIYEAAAKTCSPPVVVDVVPITHPSGAQTVAVNVDPSVEQPVASPAHGCDKSGRACRISDAWCFPIRRASQTDFIDPENLPMYMNREIRRAVLLLARIPVAARQRVVVNYYTPRDVQGRHWDGVVQLAQMTLSIGEVSVEKNRLRLIHKGSWELACAVPLLDILDVWEARDDAWEMKVAGQLRRVPGDNSERLEYTPS